MAKGRTLPQKRITRFLLHAIGRRNALLLFTIVCIMSVLDLVGIAVIFPFLQVIMQPDAGMKMAAFIGLDKAASSLTHVQLSLILGIGLALFYAGKTLLQSILIRIQARRLAHFTATQTNSIVSRVLSARYAVFQQTAASEIAGTAYSNTVHATLALTAFIQAVNEAALLILLLLGFFLLQPLLALSAVSLVVFVAFTLYMILVRRSSQLGADQTHFENIRYRLLFSITTAIRDIKIMGLEELFDTRNRNVSYNYAEIAWRFNFNNALPRLLIEFLALLAIVWTALIIVYFEIPLHEAGPLLGLAAVATVRAVPAFSRMFGAISAFKFSKPFVVRLIDLQQKLASATTYRKNDNLNFNQIIELQEVGFRYGDTRILSNISIELKRGEAIGIVGPSGAGKTTLLDLFVGLQRASEGRFICDGEIFDPFTSRSIQKMIGYVPQAITLFDESVEFNVSFEEHPDNARVMRALTMANLQKLIASLPDGIKTQVGENGLRLSGGQRQRIGIARALYHAPQILVFDEATSALDTHSEAELTAEIGKLHGEVSIVIVAHRLSSVVACDRIYVLSEGKVESSGTHTELLSTSKTYMRLYASQFREE